VLAYFVILGLAEGIWVAHIPTVKERLHLADGVLGASLLVGPAGLVLVMPLAGRLTDRFGSAWLIRPAGLYVAVLPLALGTAQTLTAVTGSVLAFGISGGFLVVALNAQALRVERGYGRPLMASFHACFSLGGLAGALLGGLLAWRRAGLFSALDSIVAACVAVAIIAGYRLLPEPARGRPGSARRSPRARRPRPGPGSPWLVALGLLALCCVITEGAVASWSGVYLRDVLGTPGWFAAAGFAGFSLAMAAGRLAGDRLAARYGRAGLVRRCGLLAVTGLAGALGTHQAWVAVAGFAACGGGLSCTVPQLFSAAGRADPDHPGRAVARVGGLGYLGLVGGPPLIGGCASLAGLTVALYIPVGLALCVTGFAFLLDRPPRAGRPAPLRGPAAPVLSGTDPGRSAGSRSR
jgi:MFS family permease